MFQRAINHIKSINRKIKGHPYAKKYILYFWIEYIKLYIIVRIFNLKLNHKWVNGIKLIIDVNDWAIARNCYLRLNEFNDSCFIVHYLKENDLFIDAGANLGHYSLLAGKISKANVIAYEPDKHTFSKIKKNIKVNNLNNRITIHNLGLGDKEEKVGMQSMRNNAHNYIINNKSVEKTIQITTLENKNLKPIPSLIKIDVEGYEKKVLIGAKNILKNPNLNALLIEISTHCERYGESIEGIYNYILDFGFKPYTYNPINRELNILDLKNQFSDNFIFIKNKEDAQLRLKSGEKIIFDKNYFL